MHESIELGRAVLSTSAANLELWLRTLITISPQQQRINPGQHNATSLLRLLLSGEVWVGRGNGLYIDLDLTFKGQPVADEQLRQLSEAILNAPAWNQLNLQPSLPYGITQAPGKLRITVNHASERAAPAVKQRHRILSDTSVADVRPPEGVPALFLDSVLLSADIFEFTQRRKIATAKRCKTSTASSRVSQSATSQAVDGLEQEELLLNPNNIAPSHAPSLTFKRMRSPASSPERSALLPAAPSSETHQNCRLLSRASGTQDGTPNPKTSLDIGDLQALIDGALRLSILSSINSKMFPEVKVKANTFELGLADIAPTLWRPGYLLSLSQRANLLPIVSHSLCQPAATKKTMSTSFRNKLSTLASPLLSLQAADRTLGRQPTGALDRSHLASSIAPRLWLHLQENTPCKSATLLQSFVATELPSVSVFQPDDMLEESWLEDSIDHRSRPSALGPNGGGTSGVDRVLEDDPATRAANNGISSEQHLFGAVATPGHVLKIVDDELLLGEEYLEPLGPVIYHGYETS